MKRNGVKLLHSEIIQSIWTERLRQEWLKEQGKFTHTCASKEISNEEKFIIFAEEVGEVARAVYEKDFSQIKKELIETLAVGFGWLESLDE